MGSGRKSRAATVSVISNTALVAGKLTIGLLSGSIGIVAEALHSAIDLAAAIIAFFAIRVAAQPADREHPYGHGKAESLSGAIEALLIVGAAVWIATKAVDSLLHGGEVERLGLGVGVMLASALVNVLVSRYLFRVARAEDSLALEADAHHLSTDVYTSLGVAGGLALVWATGWSWMDPVVALAVAAWIGWIGWSLTVRASRQLMDAKLPDEEVALVEEVLRAESRVTGWHRLRTRKSGSERHVDLHVMLPGTISLAEAHAVADALQARIAERLPQTRVVIHLEPPQHEDEDSLG